MIVLAATAVVFFGVVYPSWGRTAAPSPWVPAPSLSRSSLSGHGGGRTALVTAAPHPGRPSRGLSRQIRSVRQELDEPARRAGRPM